MTCADICGWTALAPEPLDHPALLQDQHADAIVVGGGFTGLAAARRLAELRPEWQVILLEAKMIGGGASARNSGFVVAYESTRDVDVASPKGRANYDTVSQLDRTGIEHLKHLISTHSIACDWDETGSIHAAHDTRHFDRLRYHAEAFASMGIPHQVLDADALNNTLGTSFYGLGVQTFGGALVQPAKLAQGLARTLPDTITAYANSPVVRITRTASNWTVETDHGRATAPIVIAATNALLPQLGLVKGRLFPMALTASLTRPLTDEEFSKIGSPAPWGILSPVPLGATMRLTSDRRVLIRNTGEFRPNGIPSHLLEQRRKGHAYGLAKRFDFLTEADIDYTWSGTVCKTRNGKPVFAEAAPGLFACGGYNAAGVSRSAALGGLIADRAVGRTSPLLTATLALPDPPRLPPRPAFDIGARVRLWRESRIASLDH